MSGDYIVSLSEGTYERLRAYRERGESFEDAIVWLLDFAEGNQ
jgi:hypothetical protein